MSIILPRLFTRSRTQSPAILASDHDRPWSEFLELQGFPPDYDLPWTITAKKNAIGNAVPLPIARAFAQAITNRVPRNPGHPRLPQTQSAAP